MLYATGLDMRNTFILLSVLFLVPSIGCDVGEEDESTSMAAPAVGVKVCNSWSGYISVHEKIDNHVSCYDSDNKYHSSHPVEYQSTNATVTQYWSLQCPSKTYAAKPNESDWTFGDTCIAVGFPSYEVDKPIDTPAPSHPERPRTPVDNCDYSDAGGNGGWGWDPVAKQSCPPR